MGQVQRSSVRRGIPLAFRVPNPPATFVGREAELRAVRAAIRRGRVAIVCGVGGIGKTSLALATLSKHLPDRLGAAVMIGLRPQPLQQALVEILRALAELAGRDVAFSAMAAEEELLGLALDLAEQEAAVVLLDDLHHILPGGDDVMIAAARYARRSLWIATSRVEPEGAELAGQVVRVAPLPAAKLAGLARLLAPKLGGAALREAVRDAGGSPWRLRRLLLSEGDRASPLEGISAAGRILLETLCVASLPLDDAFLASAVGEDARSVARDLERRGLVEMSPGGLRLQEAARPWVAEQLESGGTGSAKVRVARALALVTTEPEAIEALRLLLEIGDDTAALELCDRHGDRLLRAGYAPTLWKLVAPRAGRAWHTWKLRAAMQVAAVDVVKTLEPPPADALWDRLLWVRAFLVGGALKSADDAAAALVRDAEARGDRAVGFWAGLLGAMAVHHHEGAERGVTLLRALEPIDRASTLLRDILLAFWVAECGDPDAALAIVGRGDPGAVVDAQPFDVLGAPLAFFVRYYRMAALMECGHLDDAHAAMAVESGDLGEELCSARIAGNALANLAIARGHLDEARDRLQRLHRRSAQAGFADVTTLLGLERRIAAGELAGLEAELDALMAVTRERTPLVNAWCFDTRERLRTILAHPLGERPRLEALPLGSGTRALLALRHALRAARWATTEHEAAAAPHDIEGAIVHLMLEATTSLVSRRADDAADHARRAVDLARAHGWAIRELEARQLLCESLVASGADARSELAAFAARAGELPSPRFVAEARLLACAVATTFDGALLEELGVGLDVAPCAARRARAILGAEGTPLDDVDRLVLRAFRHDARVRTIGDAREWRRGWGVDVARQLLWRDDGTTAPLERHVLYQRMLVALAERGGTATFEELAHDVWQVRTFKPLSDGNRIRVTMHRLRALVGKDRIVQRESGYALTGPPFRIVTPRSVPAG